MERRIRVPQLLCITLLVLAAAGAQAQERKLVREGNELYSKQKYKEAAAAYEKALKEKPTFVPGAFNLGNALIQQKQYDAARKVMDNAAKTSTDPRVQGSAQYNKGNTYMTEAQWQQAVDAYKASLRRNPQDVDAKYNLSYALSKLKQQQEQNKDKKNDKDKQQQQDKQDKKDKGDDKKDDKQQDEKQSQEGGEQKQSQKPQPSASKLSQQQADNLLKALQQDERKTQDKMQQSKATPVKLEKDW